MSTEMQEFPDEGEIVVVTVTKIGDHGAYVGLDEYNSIQGFLHISEIAPGWVRNVRKYVTEGEKKVVLVKKIRKGKGDVQSTAAEKIIEVADLVTEMKEVKHPFKSGIKAKKGIDF